MKWVAIALIVVAVAAAMIIAPREEPAPAPAQSAAPVQAQPTASVPSPPPRLCRPPRPRAARGEGGKTRAPATVVGRRLRMAKDKRAFVDRAVAVGGGGHLYVARQAIDQCFPMREAGMSGAEKQFANAY